MQTDKRATLATPLAVLVREACDANRRSRAAGPRSLADLAAVLGVRAPTLSQYLSGARRLSAAGPRVSVATIARAAGLPIELVEEAARCTIGDGA